MPRSAVAARAASTGPASGERGTRRSSGANASPSSGLDESHDAKTEEKKALKISLTRCSPWRPCSRSGSLRAGSSASCAASWRRRSDRASTRSTFVATSLEILLERRGRRRGEPLFRRGVGTVSAASCSSASPARAPRERSRDRSSTRASRSSTRGSPRERPRGRGATLSARSTAPRGRGRHRRRVTRLKPPKPKASRSRSSPARWFASPRPTAWTPRICARRSRRCASRIPTITARRVPARNAKRRKLPMTRCARRRRLLAEGAHGPALHVDDALHAATLRIARRRYGRSSRTTSSTWRFRWRRGQTAMRVAS